MRKPWAPWTALAARRLGDAPTLARCERALVASIRRRPPHAGGAGVTPVPETALTAVTVEALARCRSCSGRAAVERARAFLLERRLVGRRVTAPLEPSLAAGGFALSPVLDGLRTDRTAHAVRALAGR